MNKTDLEFFKTQLLAEKGEHKLNVFLKKSLDNSFVEAIAMQQSINTQSTFEKSMNLENSEIYLN